MYGKYEIDAEIDDYSTAYELLTDKYELFKTDILFTKLMQNVQDRVSSNSKIHRYKFDVWKHSMHLRLRIDFIATLTLSIV